MLLLTCIISLNDLSNTVKEADIPTVSILDIKKLRADGLVGKNIRIIWRHNDLNPNILHLHKKLAMAGYCLSIISALENRPSIQRLTCQPKEPKSYASSSVKVHVLRNKAENEEEDT